MRNVFSSVCVGGPLSGRHIESKVNPMSYVDLGEANYTNEIDTSLNLDSHNYHWGGYFLRKWCGNSTEA